MMAVVCSARSCGVFLFLLLGLCSAQLYPDWPDPPNWMKKPEMARYVVHYGTWGVVSGISPVNGHVPFGTIQSYADGPMDGSSGIPYFYIANISDTFINMEYSNKMSLTISMAQGDRCKMSKYDAEDPRCSRLTMLGTVVSVTDSKEEYYARKSLFARHPVMEDWPSGHGWQFYKLDVTKIYLLDFFGGAADINLDDYYKADPIHH